MKDAKAYPPTAARKTLEARSSLCFTSGENSGISPPKKNFL